MRKNAFILLILTAFLGAFCLAGIAVAVDSPDSVKLYDDAFTKKKKGPVEFSHKKHHDEYGVGCTDCHHVYKDGQNVWKEGDAVQKCAECHKLKKEGDVDKLQNAFHNNCKDCHKELKKGPYEKCNDCHGEKE